jgi:glycosyltransferase involved in cell wall biosynthesis
MSLTIITINRNNAIGLEKTMKSVFSQTSQDFNYVIIDGASSDGSVEIIQQFAALGGDRFKWLSEPDCGIYNAMNKGLLLADGEYIQILNSGDCLASEDVTERMLSELDNKGKPSILYGNMIKCFPDGHRLVDKCFAGNIVTLLGMYSGTLNHDPVYVRRNLFEKYGYYDESLRIVSDWKWYFQAIILGDEKPAYVDIDVTLFDMTGISETNLPARNEEKRQELAKLLPSTIIADYDAWASDIDLVKRLKRHPMVYKLVWFLERCLFKLEKIQMRKSGIQLYQ